ncbi:MAG: methionyl-tRNA formyltransferase [Thermodesulfobacteriota bacterium]|nr:MAG: methionyl-tRNA formyltransferase [Thermodesulfobacteriota bacterium]
MAGPAAKIIFMGTPLFAVPSLRALIAAGHHVLAVVTQPDKPRGRGLSPLPSPVKVLALENGIPVIEPLKLRDESFVERLRSLGPDLIAVVAYGKILPPAILSLPPKGCVNLHASLLPKYRGAAPINRAIMNGEKETGVCTMLMDEGMDTGDTLICERVPIGEDDTAEDLARTLSEKGAAALLNTVDLMVKDAVKPVPQDDSLATYAPVLKKEDGRVDWTRSGIEVKNQVRGLYPWPGAFTCRKGSLLKIHRGMAKESAAPAGEPGAVLEAGKDGILVACGKGAFLITELQPENKKRMSAAEFVAGYRIAQGERLG